MQKHADPTSWTTDELQGATFVELFFDLVFVFAVTSITGTLLEHLDWASVGRNAIILYLVWWAWTQFTWTLNPANTDHTAVRLITLAATATAFVMAQAIPDAFDDAGAWFAFSYVFVRLLGLALQLGMQDRSTESRRTVFAWVAGSSIGLVLVVAGGLVDTPARTWLWVGAMVMDMAIATRAARGGWQLQAPHFAERHGLIVIIALGESLIAAGVALGHVPRDGSFALGTMAAVGAICAMWWIYFVNAKDHMEEFLSDATDEQVGALARDIYSWGHLPIIAGIIAIAIAIERALAHPHDQLETGALVALGVGVVLYLSGIAYGLHRSRNQAVMPLLAAAGLVVGLLAIAQSVAGITALAMVAVILAGLALVGQSGRSSSI